MQSDLLRKMATSRVALPILLVVEAIIILLLQWSPEIEAQLDPRLFRPEIGHAHITPVPPIAPRLRKLPSDGPDWTESTLLLFRNGQLLGPAHSEWSDVRERGSGAYLHWGGVIVLSTPGNVDPRTDGATYTLRTTVIWTTTPHVVLLVLALLVATSAGWVAIGHDAMRRRLAAGRDLLRMWRDPRALFAALIQPDRRLAAPVRVTLSIVVVLLAAAIVAAACWRPLVVATLKPKQFAAEHGHLFLAKISTFAPYGYQLGGDDVPRSFRSEISVMRNGEPLGPGHAVHDDIRNTGGGAYALWNGTLYFSTPHNSDPRSDGAAYSISARAQPMPETVGLVFLCAIGFAALSQLFPAVREITRRVAFRGRSFLARACAALLVAGAISAHMADTWDQYVANQDSSGYFNNAFTESSFREPGVFVWNWLFSDPRAINAKIAKAQTNVVVTAAPGDPAIAGVRAQRLLLVFGLAALAFAMGFLVHPMLAMLVALCIAPVESMSFVASGLAIAAAFALLLAISRGPRARLQTETPSTASAALADASGLARSRTLIVPALVLGATAWSFFPSIFENSFFSQEEILVGSDALTMGLTFLFVAALMWFVRAGAATALVLCAVLASLSILTRPGAVFVGVLFAGLSALALYRDWRRFLVPVMASATVAVILINSVAIYGVMSGRRGAGALNSTTTVVIAFALSIAEPEDEKVLREDIDRRFFRAAMARRSAALARVAADDPHPKWAGIIEIFREAAWPAANEVLGTGDLERESQIFMRTTWAVARNRPLEYASLIAESLAIGAGVGPYSITRLFHSYADWLVLFALVALALWGALRDRPIGVIALFLIAGHFGYLAIAALSVTPTSRYAQSTEWMVVLAILLLVARQLELMLLLGRRDRAELFGSRSEGSPAVVRSKDA